MLQSAALAGMEPSKDWCAFAKVRFNGAYAHFKQLGDFFLIPVYGFRITEVQNCILCRQVSVWIGNDKPSIDQLLEVAIRRCEIRNLP
ncbi:hypothetical protein D3C77_632480 [compost metagenome]